MLTPTESDVHGPAREAITKFYQGAAVGADERIRLFRLAWDLTGTQFGSRQALYERFFNGDVVRLRQGRYQGYDFSDAVGMVDRFLEQIERGEAGLTALTPGPSP
jgi:4-hydroxyphenylacetate 3-monooxygenase